MSRDDAPNYRVHDCCFHCQFSFIGYAGVDDKCMKHKFQFNAGDKLAEMVCGAESQARVCDDFKRWENEPR